MLRGSELKISKVLPDGGDRGSVCMEIGDSLLIQTLGLKENSNEVCDVAEWNTSYMGVRTKEVRV